MIALSQSATNACVIGRESVEGVRGAPPSHLADAAREHGGTRTKVGRIVRVRDQRIRARYNELSRESTAPLLKGRLVQQSSGTRIVGEMTRIVGEIQWTNVIAAPFAMVLVTLVLLAIAVSAISGSNQLLGLCFLLGAVVFGALSVMTFRSQSIERECEEGRLRDELLTTFTKPGPH